VDQSWHADFFVRNFRARHIIEEDATAYVRRNAEGVTNYVCMGHISMGTNVG